MNRDIVFSGVTLALSAFLMVMTGNIGVTGGTVVSSALFPRIVLCIIMILSAVQLYCGLKFREPDTVRPVHWSFWFLLALLSGMLALMSCRQIGFLPAAVAFMTVFAVFMSGSRAWKNWLKLFGFSLIVAFAVHHIFTRVLSFILP